MTFHPFSLLSAITCGAFLALVFLLALPEVR